jgi:processive 1,2-diacylglycerol beta-glucosyltransferase
MKILITYGYAGIGHKKAAEAIYAVLKEQNAEVQIVDVLDYTNAFFKFSYPRIYLFLINRTPTLWGFFYYLLDLGIADKPLSPLRRFLNNLNAKKFIRFILEEKPDIVISTHFLPSEVIAGLKRKGIFKGKLITVVTDFLPHSFWMVHDSDYFIAAIERTKKELVRRGINEEKVKVFGIPCNPVFGISKGRQKLIRELGMEEGFFNLLIMGGGFGTGPVREIVQSICNRKSAIRDKVQTIVICGKNEKLFEDLNRLKQDLKARLCIFGYMDNIDEFMEVSGSIITKSGGLTISEALSKKLPMIIIQPIPGQETRNCNVLTDYGTAVRANSVRAVKKHVTDFINLPEKIIGMKVRINLLSYPDAARDIVRFALSL